MPARKIRQVISPAAFPTYKNVGVYCRVSTGSMPQLHSLAEQVSYYVQMLRARPPYKLYDIYIDVCSGAKNLERVQYQRMLQDCRAGKIDTIMTKSFSRFGRDTVEVISTLRELNRLGINVIFENDNIDTATEDSELVITILSAVAQADNESRRKNIKWGMTKRAEDGTSGFYRRRCYGYEHDENGKLAIKPDEAEIVRQVYAAYLEGRSFHAIARELTEKGVSSPNGKAQWCNRTIDVMLSNEKYAGDVILFKTVSAEDLFGESLAETMKRKTYKIAESHPAIISKEDFNRVQEMKKQRSRKKVDYLPDEQHDE